jgi:hypothetical protein
MVAVRSGPKWLGTRPAAYRLGGHRKSLTLLSLCKVEVMGSSPQVTRMKEDDSFNAGFFISVP